MVVFRANLKEPMRERENLARCVKSTASEDDMQDMEAARARRPGVVVGAQTSTSDSPNPWLQAALALAVGVVWLCVSGGLISYNKFLMHESRFPYAAPLVLWHSIFCSSLAGVLLFLRPSLFPSLTDPDSKIVVDRHLVLTSALPIAAVFAGSLVLSNAAYQHCSVSFLQMMKEANVVLVYVFSLGAGLEKFSWKNLTVLVFIVSATALTIREAIEFSLLGFLIQGSGQLVESCKLVLQGRLLSSRGMKLDVLSYTLLILPMCASVLGLLLISTVVIAKATGWDLAIAAVPRWADIVAWWPHLLLNAMAAFTLNLVSSFFVKITSAVAFTLAGVAKDIAIVLMGLALMGDNIGSFQAVGFGLQLIGVLAWSYLRLRPKQQEAAICNPSREGPRGFDSIGSPGEKEPLCTDKDSEVTEVSKSLLLAAAEAEVASVCSTEEGSTLSGEGNSGTDSGRGSMVAGDR